MVASETGPRHLLQEHVVLHLATPPWSRHLHRKKKLFYIVTESKRRGENENKEIELLKPKKII